MATLGTLKPSEYKESKQGKWSKEKIQELLEDYKKISFKDLYEQRDKYIGTIVRYFRSGKFRMGAFLKTVQMLDEDTDPPTGYAGFAAISPKVTWTTQSKTSEFWVLKNPKRGRKKKDSSESTSSKKTKVSKKNANIEKAHQERIYEVRKKWFTNPAQLTGKSSEEKRIYVAVDVSKWKIHTAKHANTLTLPDGGIVSSRVVYNRVTNGNNRLYRHKYMISRLNYKTLGELRSFLKSPMG